MEKNFAQLVSNCQNLILSQSDTYKVISYLYDEGVSLVDTIKIIRKVYNVPLEEAKKIVSAHPLWSNTRDYASLFLEILALAPDSTYGDWLEVYLFGFPQQGNFHVSTDAATQKEVSTLLKNIMSADKEVQNTLIQDVARNQESILNTLIVLLEQSEPVLLGLIIAIIQKIGAPENIRAIPWLIDIAIDQESVAMQEAIKLLKDMDSKMVIPFLTAILLNRNDKDNNRVKNINSTCQLLLQKREWMTACGPTIVYLLSQEDDREKNTLNKELLLSVLEPIFSTCAYAIPAIYRIAITEENSSIGQRAKNLLRMFSDDKLKPYRYSIAIL